MFRHKAHHEKRVSYSELGTTYFETKVPDGDSIKTTHVRHVPDESVLPELPEPSVFSLENSLRTGKNLSPVSSNVLSPTDPITGEGIVTSMLDKIDNTPV